MNEKNERAISLSMLIGSMLIFGTIGIFRRFLPLSSPLLACFRGVSGALFLVLFSFLRKRKLKHAIGKKKVALLILSGALIGFNWILLFEAYNYTTVPTATLCYYMAPTLVILFSPLLLREKLSLKKGICALVAIIGMVFISGIPESALPAAAEGKGILLGLGAALFYALVVILNKKISGVDAYEKTIIQLLSASLILVPYLLFTEDFSEIRLDGVQILLLLTLGFVHTGIAYLLYFGGIDRLSAQSAAIFSYIDPISALVLSAIILKESLTLLGIFGAVMILGAAMISEIRLPVRKAPVSPPIFKKSEERQTRQ